MSEGAQLEDATAVKTLTSSPKTLTPITTTTATVDDDKTDTPTSPELPTVVATKPPTELGAPPENKAEVEHLAAIPESATDETVTADETQTANASEPTPAASEVEDGESFSTLEANAESLPSPELTTIPLSPSNDPVPTQSTAAPSAENASEPSPQTSDPSDTKETSGQTATQASEPTPTLAQASEKVLTSPTSVGLPKRHPTTPRPLRKPTGPVGAGLDSLLSPTESEGKSSPFRTSVAGSDVTDDDSTRFSTVLLSARQSLAVPPKSPSGAASNGLHTVDEGTGSDESTLVEDWRKHKKTASNSTILSANNVPYFMAQLGSAGTGAEPVEEDRQGEEEDGGGYVDPDTAVDWAFWGKVMNDYQGYASQHPEELARAIERGIPKTLRGMVWQLMSASKDPELETTYLRLLKETSPHEKSIQRDLGRTFPHHAFFTDGHGIGQENLFNVLKAYSLYDPQVGYCQGLPFIVAILLLNMPDEEAFCLLVRLMHSYDLRGHFLPEMPKLQLRLFQFERLLEEVLPVLHLHFVRQGIKASMYCSQWFLTMFSYRFPIDIVFRIYDNCLASGIEAMFAFSMALLSKNEMTLLNMKFDQLVSFLNQRVFEVYQIGPVNPNTPASEVRYRVDEFVQDAISLRITPFMLDNYAHEYEELVRARDAHKLEMENLKNTNQRLAAQVKNLETSLAQLNTEHCEVLNELVRARLRHEELEGELVRYKLLYAEAMHQSEDAMSSHRISLVSSKRGSASTNG